MLDGKLPRYQDIANGLLLLLTGISPLFGEEGKGKRDKAKGQKKYIPQGVLESLPKERSSLWCRLQWHALPRRQGQLMAGTELALELVPSPEPSLLQPDTAGCPCSDSWSPVREKGLIHGLLSQKAFTFPMDLFEFNSWQLLNPGVISKLTRDNNPIQLAIRSPEQMDFYKPFFFRVRVG